MKALKKIPRNYYVGAIVFAIVGIWFLLLFLLNPGHKQINDNYLPKAATNIEDAGNGWMTFELNDKKYLFNNIGAITQAK